MSNEKIKKQNQVENLNDEQLDEVNGGGAYFWYENDTVR